MAYLGLGSSLGDRRKNLETALDRIVASGNEIALLRTSSFYESPHMGLAPGDDTRFPAHLNCVAEIATSLTPEKLLDRVHHVEQAGGRRRDVRWGPRTIDIDILLFADRTIELPSLIVPHPGIAGRAFVLLPLFELSPKLCLPDGQAIADLMLVEKVRSQQIHIAQ